MKRISLIVIVALIAVAAGVFAFRKLFPEPGIQVLETAPVEKGEIKGVLVATGILKPQVGAVVKIGSRATGAIVQMNVRVGDRVKKGELIALIDDRDILRTLERQRAALESAKATLEQVELTYPHRIKEAQANFNYAKISYDREQELMKHEYTTADALDKARNNFLAREAALRALQNEYRTQLEISKSRIEELEAQVKESEVRLSYTKIYAPIDGIVSEVTTQLGETIVTGLQSATLVTVLDPTRLEMSIYVDETDVGKIKQDQDVEYYVDTFPERIFHGKIQKIYPQPVTKDNIVYYLAVVEVSPQDAEVLKPEMTTHVKVVFQEKKDILTAPNAAIKFEGGKQIAYRVAGKGRVEKVEIKTGIRGEDRTEILSGVREGDELATKLILPVASKP